MSTELRPGRFLDETRRELGAVKQANIVSQMMESHLLKSVASCDAESVKVSAVSIPQNEESRIPVHVAIVQNEEL